MDVYCQILIQNTREGIHKSGNPVKGIIKYSIDKPTTYRRIVVSLIGEGSCWWREIDSGKARGSTNYIGTEDYVNQQIEVLDPSDGNTTINPGLYEFPFHFVLPENIPSSIKNKTCTIEYRLEVKFIKPGMFSIDKKFQSELTVYGSVKPTTPEGPVIFGLQKTLFKPFSAKKHNISLKAEIDRTGLAPGENVKVNYEVTNDSDTTITSVVISLVCYTIYKANCGRERINSKKIGNPVSSTAISSNKNVNLSAVIPIPPDSYTIQHSKIMVRQYKVTATVRLPLPHWDDTAEVQVLVGERHDRVVNIEFDEAIGEDHPPSYSEAMAEGKGPQVGVYFNDKL